jgi:hypothetical protein
VNTCQPTKRKAEVDGVNKPPVKKRKEDPPVPQLLNVSYKAQVRGVREVFIIYAVKFQSSFEVSYNPSALVILY